MINWSEFEIVDKLPEEHFAMKPCLRILFFLNGDLQEVGPGMLRLYDKSMALLGGDCQFHFKPFRARYGADGYLKLAKITKATEAFVQDYLKEKAEAERWAIQFETTRHPYGVSDRALQMQHIQVERSGFMSLVLPVDHFGTDFDALAALADSFAQEVPFYSGYVGYALHVSFGKDGLRRFPGTPIELLSKKYLGLDCRLPEDVAEIECAGGAWQSDVGAISNVGWITYLGEKTPAIKKASSVAGVVARPCRYGCGYQLGPSPSLLSEAGASELKYYRALAEVILVRDGKRRIETLDFAGGEQSTLGWLRRFL